MLSHKFSKADIVKKMIGMYDKDRVDNGFDMKIQAYRNDSVEEEQSDYGSEASNPFSTNRN